MFICFLIFIRPCNGQCETLIDRLLFAGFACNGHTEGDNAFSETRNCGRRHVENTVSARIINGTEAEPGSWPWMVGLYNENDTLYCGGVLISDRFVLTAAHCLPYVHNSSVSWRRNLSFVWTHLIDKICCTHFAYKCTVLVNLFGNFFALQYV